ncbi:rhomboid family intramembrane serine protease [Fodinicola feengrottensis]|uniref:Rhomboid family intramembrane serine protease n=2 Tax=Fodinicola feengrottensis TaxID=435914 RepID=A0ABN2GW26_9ACTN
MTMQPPSGLSSPPMCYRHPSRETHIRCIRCNKPICPDCMNAASVGFQCPDCVREGSRTVRSGQTVFGGSLSGERGTVTYVLIALNIGVYVANLIWSAAAGASVQQLIQIAGFGGGPDLDYLAGAANNGQFGGIDTGQFWRLLTSDFVHIGILHLAVNMYALFLFGRECERLLGRWRFLVLYLLTGIGGGTLVYLFQNVSSAGASASLFGLLAAMFFFFRKLKANLGGLVGMIVINLGITFFVPGISILGHLGGMASGALLGIGLAYAPRGPMRLPVQVGTMVAVAILLFVLVAGKTLASSIF